MDSLNDGEDEKRGNARVPAHVRRKMRKERERRGGAQSTESASAGVGVRPEEEEEEEMAAALAPPPVPSFARDLSAHSQWVAARATHEAPSSALRVTETALRVLALGSRMGVLTLREKAELKEMVLSRRAAEALDYVRSRPGSRAVFDAYASASAAASTTPTLQGKTLCLALKPGYVVRMTPHEHGVLASAVQQRSLLLQMGMETEGQEQELPPPQRIPVATSEVVIASKTKTKQELHAGTQRVRDVPNAGGHSEHSEALSFEVLHALLGASDVVTEMQIVYATKSPIADYVCTVRGVRVGVSVTRALTYAWPGPHAFEVEDAARLLERKLTGLERAKRSVVDEFAWKGHVLHVWAQDERVQRCLLDALASALFRSTAVVLVTLCRELDHVVFGNDARFELPNPHAFVEDARGVRERDARAVDALIQRSVERSLGVRGAAQRLREFHSISTSS